MRIGWCGDLHAKTSAVSTMRRNNGNHKHCIAIYFSRLLFYRDGSYALGRPAQISEKRLDSSIGCIQYGTRFGFGLLDIQGLVEFCVFGYLYIYWVLRNRGEVWQR